ncbi:hypothetical protein L596_001501 [Steinernema carpocapsae]|uniref:Anaphase-promoting complex subunit 4 WD40 domain-containing protein n=1 Tax=Steinernema carpocapsae TaxID=34508 RepID=A0A4U8ULR2_STECR|nr:hypothetical protein L596_001501 [Steinernema carpocapsae]
MKHKSELIEENRDQILIVQHGHPVTLASVTTGLQEKKLFLDIPGTGEENTTCAVFDRRGKYVITGSSKGRIIIYDAKTQNVVAHCRQTVNHQIRQFVVSQRGDWIVTNTNDRIIRCYKLDILLSTTGVMAWIPSQSIKIWSIRLLGEQ